MAAKENVENEACSSSSSETKLHHDLSHEKYIQTDCEQPKCRRDDDTERCSLCYYCDNVPVVAYCDTCKSPLCTFCCDAHIRQKQYKKHIIINFEHKITECPEQPDNRSSSDVGYDSAMPQRSGAFKLRKKLKRKRYPKDVSDYHIKHIQLPNRIKTNGGKMGRVFRMGFSNTGIWAIADFSNHCIHVCDANNELIKIFGNKGKAKYQFNHPVGITFDSEGCLYVSEYGNHRIQKFDAKFGYVLQFGDKGEKYGRLDHPMGIAVYEDKVYVADSANGCIAVFYTNGEFCCNIVSGCLRDPYDISINKTNKQLLVTDSACCIRIYSLKGEYINRFSGFGADRGQLNHPASLAIDSNNFVFVADTYNHRICVFDSTGMFVHSFGSFGNNIGQFSYPQGIAFSPIGTLLISDTENKRVVIFPTKFKPGLKIARQH